MNHLGLRPASHYALFVLEYNGRVDGNVNRLHSQVVCEAHVWLSMKICDDLRRGLIIFSLVLCDCLIELTCDGARILVPCCCAHWRELNSRTNAGAL